MLRAGGGRLLGLQEVSHLLLRSRVERYLSDEKRRRPLVHRYGAQLLRCLYALGEGIVPISHVHLYLHCVSVFPG